MDNPFKKRHEKMTNLKILREGTKKSGKSALMKRTAEAFVKCPSCGKEYTKLSLSKTLYVCESCNHHYPISAYCRLKFLLDTHSFCELDCGIKSGDPLIFPGYKDKVTGLRNKTGLDEAVVTATGKIDRRKAVFAVMDSRFLMGSMGVAVGEKITRAIEYANRKKLPIIIFSASGGARMQEGIFSLMQMAKTSAAIARFSQNGGLFISYFTHPTTGGVTASFASLGDIMLAEPNALIGFAGPRVIEQTIKQTLPDGFQRSEYMEEHGFLDAIVNRCDMRSRLSLLLKLHDRKGGKLSV